MWTSRQEELSLVQQYLGHAIEPGFDRFPSGHDLSEQAVIARAVVVLLQMAKLVTDYIVNTIARRFDQMRVEKDDPCGRAASPLFLHANDPPIGHHLEPPTAVHYR